MDLLQRFTHGEIDAFETLVHQFQGDIYAWTVRIVRDPGVAEDLTVETLWRIYGARHQFRPDGNFGAWARRIATNLAITICGATGRKKAFSPSLREYRSLILDTGVLSSGTRGIARSAKINAVSGNEGQIAIDDDAP